MTNNKQPFEYDYIHTQFKNIPIEQQERVKLEFNPELKKKKNEIVEAKKLVNTEINLLRSENNTVKNIEKAIKQYLFGKDKTQINVVNNSTGLNAVINSKSVHEMINEANNVENKHEDKAGFRAELYNIIANSKNIFETSEYILSYNEAKKLRLKGKQKIHKYANIVNTNYGDFITVFTLFDNNSEKTIKIYDLESFEQNESSGDLVTKSATPSRTNITIAQLYDFVQSKLVQKYNNDYKILQKEHAEKSKN